MQATRLVEGLRRELKLRRMTYADLAERMGLAETTVKRMFSKKNFTLDRLDQALAAIGCDLEDIAQVPEQDLVSRLTEAQESQLVGDPQVLLIAVCAMNSLTAEQILASYRLQRAEVTRALNRLQKIGLLKVAPNQRIKLLLAQNFEWLPGGPIQTYFKTRAAQDFLNAPFNAEGESLRLMNVMLTTESLVLLKNRMRQIEKEILQLHREETKQPFEKRRAVSLLMAVRPWLAKDFEGFRK